MKYYYMLSILLISSFAIQAKDVTVALESSGYPPYYYREDGKLTGLSVEVFEHVSENLGYQVDYKEYPWLRINQFMREGKIDMSVLYLKTDERERFVIYSETPYIYERYFLYYKNNAAIEYDDNLNALKQYRVGMVSGYSYGPELDSYELPNKIEAGTEQQLIDMLIRGRLDMIIGDRAVIDYHLTQRALQDEIATHSKAVAKVPAYYVVSRAAKNATLLAEQFSQELRLFLNSAEYLKLLRKYGLQDAAILK